MFTITVPKDFGAKKLTWTLVANGKTTQVPVGLDTLWELNPFKDATGNTPPFDRLHASWSVRAGSARPDADAFRQPWRIPFR